MSDLVETVDVRPSTLPEILEAIAEVYDRRAHSIAERYDEIAAWDSETKMEEAESNAAALREAAARIEEAEAEVEALDQKCRALSVAHGPKTCGCSYDRQDDICAAHSPKLLAALARIEALEKAAAPFMAAAHVLNDNAVNGNYELFAGVCARDLLALARAAGGGE